MSFAPERHVIFMTLAGSQAHGTAREGSDVDLRGVFVAPMSVRLSLFNPCDHHDGPLPEALAERVIPRVKAHPTAARGLAYKTECALFDVAKFVRLCAEANPNALEVLFADERDWLLESPAWRTLHAARQRFLTQKAQQTFHGYAMAQLKKIKTHRGWLLSPPAKKPSREDFGLPASESTLSADDRNRIEASLADKVRSYGIDAVEMPRPARIAMNERLAAFYRDVLGAADDDEVPARMRAVATQGLRLPPEVVRALQSEKRYLAAMKHWEAYERWKSERNPARAALEAQHGYDTKHAMHLVRLMRMGLEVLAAGELRVRRHDAAELAAIRDGALPFDALLDQVEAMRAAIERAAEVTTLPPDVDHDAVDALLMTVLGV